MCSANGLSEGHNGTYVYVCVCLCMFVDEKITQKRLNLCGIKSAGLELRATREQTIGKVSKTEKEIGK